MIHSTLILILVATFACERAAPTQPPDPWEPFETLSWTTLPTDDQVIEAYVGRGGTESERSRFRALVASTLNPYLRGRDIWDSDAKRLEALVSELSEKRSQFNELLARHGLSRAEAAYKLVADDAMLGLHGHASDLAHAHLMKDLWPPEHHSSQAPYATASLSEVRKLAREFEAEFAAFRDRVERVVPSLFADVADVADAPDMYWDTNYLVRMTYASIAIATGRSYARSWGPLHRQLVERGIPTTYVPEPPRRGQAP